MRQIRWYLSAAVLIVFTSTAMSQEYVDTWLGPERTGEVEICPPCYDPQAAEPCTTICFELVAGSYSPDPACAGTGDVARISYSVYGPDGTLLGSGNGTIGTDFRLLHSEGCCIEMIDCPLTVVWEAHDTNNPLCMNLRTC
jgi:hypothetical protein